jgi:hypothetical protein
MSETTGTDFGSQALRAVNAMRAEVAKDLADRGSRGFDDVVDLMQSWLGERVVLTILPEGTSLTGTLMSWR